jgi:putative ABC transport system permease protein
MIWHSFKLIWNRKRSSKLLIIEILISFLVIFAISSISIELAENYFSPLGYKAENVWSFYHYARPESEFMAIENSDDEDYKKAEAEKVRRIRRQILDKMKTHPEIDAFAASSQSHPYENFLEWTKIQHNSNDIWIGHYKADDNLPSVMSINVVKGRWFDQNDDASTLPPAIINQKLKEEIYPDEDALGKTLLINDNEYKIVGLIDAYRHWGVFDSQKNVVFTRVNMNADDGEFTNILMKVKPGVGGEFEAKMIEEIRAMVPEWKLELNTLEKMKASIHKQQLTPLAILLIICSFLILNVALGLFGVLWYNINQRISELGLRRAVGSTGNRIKSQLITETLILASFGIIGGAIIAFQFPLLNVFNIRTWVYLLAILISVLVMLTLAALCAWYPGRQAARIDPATALHEE